MTSPVHVIAPCSFQGPAAATPTSRRVPPHDRFVAATQPSRKRTRFHPTTTVQPFDCGMTSEERSRSHYSRGEMESFSFEVRAIRAVSEACPALCGCAVHPSGRECARGLGAGDASLRGLEIFLCPARYRNRAVAQGSLLRFQKKLLSNPDKTEEEKARILAAASAKLSRWAGRVAVETARSDSLAAYAADYLIPIDEVADDAPITPFRQKSIPRRVTCDDSRPAKRARSC